MMYAETPDIPAGRILDISLQRLHSLRRSVIKDIIAKSKEHKHIVINTHATFRWRHGLFPAFDFYQMRQLNPDLFIGKMCNVEVETESSLTLGHTAVDFWYVTDRPKNANWIYEVDADGFFALLLERLKYEK